MSCVGEYNLKIYIPSKSSSYSVRYELIASFLPHDKMSTELQGISSFRQLTDYSLLIITYSIKLCQLSDIGDSTNAFK